ncbi:MAG: helix-turn-helix domain-containing protein [Deltaproteobacteria bacterium]|nr:helix-turn-helix domain-containing protein [Deltaproteobacteria bacterium]
MLTTGEVADFLRVNRSTVCRLAGRGELPAFRIGSDWRFSRERIEAWLRSRNRAPEG